MYSNVVSSGAIRPGSRAALNAHIADGHAAGHVQSTDSLSAIFKDVANAAAGAILGDDGEDDVLGCDANTQGAFNVYREGHRLLLQKALRRQNVADLAGTDTERQRPESAVSTGVAVPAYDRHARLGDA